MIRCTDTSDAITDHGLPVFGWGIIHSVDKDQRDRLTRLSQIVCNRLVDIASLSLAQ